ncbi:penicillin-binding protein 2 [Tepidiphilus baoligensis]|uniref:Peptidoglycan D,D-transpeptidase MrdA n=1 Tax=Tepidiphilus baoligensis TaxID=2698687 RepID=A0ABX1QM70_9PROT|nr:penicillin-binding protein 2 [Tepidiphilus baoligensis]NMH17046.1 penicillin-binding protein 2 [Tepidiphilus baoligensis]
MPKSALGEGSEIARTHRRLWVLVVVMLVGFGLLLGRMYQLQIGEHERFRTLADDNRQAFVPIAPHRGQIFDVRGEALARNVRTYTLELDPAQVKDVEGTIARLSEVVRIEESDHKRFLRQMRDQRGLGSVVIRQHLSDEEVARFVAKKFAFPGVEVQARLIREYPQAEVTAHVVGYLGRINAQEQERLEAEGLTGIYRGTESIGKEGVEAQYERLLHGIPGWELLEVNAAGRAVRLLGRQEAVRGRDLVLTIDARLQRFVLEAFAGRRGAFVALDPRDGGVIAMVSSPSFDPNLFLGGLTQADWERLALSDDKPLFNRALRGTYPPGSTFKPFMAMLGLASGSRQPGQRFDRQGMFEYSGVRLYDRKRNCQSGVDLHRALAFSCNVYFYSLGNELGIDAISAFMEQLGFGRRTGIDLPGEAAGVLPSREWKRQRFNQANQQQWFGGETLSTAIGQGYNAYTPLKMAHALSILVNGGVIRKPHVLAASIDPLTGERVPVAGEVTGFVKLDPAHVDAVLRAMVDGARIGTSARAFAGAAYSLGGKTGTAQVFSLQGRKYDPDATDEDLLDHSWFIAFAPAEEPRIVAAIIVENGGPGGRTAAPLMRQIFDYHFSVAGGKEK